MPEVTLIDTMEQAREATRAFLDSDRFVAFDTETTGLYVRTPYGDTPRTVQISFRPWLWIASRWTPWSITVTWLPESAKRAPSRPPMAPAPTMQIRMFAS